MTHTKLSPLRFLSISAVLACTLPLHAAEPIHAHWTDVCKAAGGDQLTLTTTNGDTVEGYCTSVDVSEISVSTPDKRVVRIARTALAKIEKHNQNNEGRQLRALGRGLNHGFGLLLSPMAPLGLAVVPPMLAWAAVAAPFCAIGDAIHDQAATQEIQVI